MSGLDSLGQLGKLMKMSEAEGIAPSRLIRPLSEHLGRSHFVDPLGVRWGRGPRVCTLDTSPHGLASLQKMPNCRLKNMNLTRHPGSVLSNVVATSPTWLFKFKLYQIKLSEKGFSSVRLATFQALTSHL